MLIAADCAAEVVEFKILKREPFAGGQAFGDVGPYEQITAIARFAIDPKHARNRVIVDLDLAPTNADGKVEFAADVFILAPKDPAKGNGAIFYDVNNRGNKLALGMFNRPPADRRPMRRIRPATASSCGRATPSSGPAGSANCCPATAACCCKRRKRENGKPCAASSARRSAATRRSSRCRCRAAQSWLLSADEGRAKRRRAHQAARARRTSASRAARPVEADQRMPMRHGEGRRAWHNAAARFGSNRRRLRARLLYELICEGEGSLVQGVGFAGVRDLISFLRHDATEQNPLRKADGKPAINRAVLLRRLAERPIPAHLLYQASTTTSRAASSSTA